VEVIAELLELFGEDFLAFLLSCDSVPSMSLVVWPEQRHDDLSNKA
jgi:hypothetical protein